MQLYLVDTLGPFFRRAPQKRLNWSKVRFGDLEREGDLSRAAMAEVRAELDRLCERVSAVGFNAITLDDLAHLVEWPGNSRERRRLVARYREECRRPSCSRAGLTNSARPGSMDTIPTLARAAGAARATDARGQGQGAARCPLPS